MGPKSGKPAGENAKVKIEEEAVSLSTFASKKVHDGISGSFPHFALCTLTFAF
jgi:hypothetical protein